MTTETSQGPRATTQPRSPISVSDEGLTLLYEPQDDHKHVVADIIFVHGLQGHPRRTWQYGFKDNPPRSKLRLTPFWKRSNNDPQPTKPASVYWPEELLPHDQKKMRILTYGYDSHISHFFRGPANKLNISQHGEALLNRVSGERSRSGCIGRPIIFVAHSLGGLLVKEALIESRKQQHSGKADLFMSTRGIVFFGTPHLGSDDAKWGLLLSTIASAAFDTSKQVLRALDPDSEKLDNLARDFQDILDGGKLKICSLQESAGKTGLPIFNDKVVPDTSSSLRSRLYEHRGYINKNHMDMCRFDGKHDSGYMIFKDGLDYCLEDITREHHNEIKGKEGQSDAQRADLLHSLKFANMSHREAQIVNAQPETCEWVWSEQTGRQSLSSWLSRQADGVFWVQGKPGSGKSTLMNYLKGHHNTMTHLRGCSDHPWVIIRFYFDFRAGKDTSNNVDGLLRSLLFQLVDELPELAHIVKESVTDKYLVEKQMSWKDVIWSRKNLHTALVEGVRTCTKNICLFIDGLDEFDGNSKDILDLIDLFKSLAGCKHHSSARVKLCLASRPEPLYLSAFDTGAGLRMQDQNTVGIKEHVFKRLRIATETVGTEASVNNDLLSISDAIVEKAKGVFLWASLAIDDLIEGYSKGLTMIQLQKRLMELPEDLQSLYDRVIDRLSRRGEDSKATAVMLYLASLSLQPLMLIEFYAVFQFEVDGRYLKESTPDSWVFNTFPKRIMALTGGLAEVVYPSDSAPREDVRVQLIHETVNTYLRHSDWPEVLGLTDNNFYRSHRLISDICISYLEQMTKNNNTLDYKGNISSSIEDVQKKAMDFQGRFAFYPYAARHVFDHVSLLESESSTSSFPMLHGHMGNLFYLHWIAPLGRNVTTSCKFCSFYYHHIGFPDTNPFNIALFHQLKLYCGDAMRKGEIFGRSYTDEIALIAFSAIDPDFSTWAVSLLIDNGMQVTEEHVSQALATAQAELLAKLLDNLPIDLRKDAKLYLQDAKRIIRYEPQKIELLIERSNNPEAAHTEIETMKREMEKLPKENPISFKDAVGRKFAFPFHLVKTWTGMEEIIRQAFLYVEVIGLDVEKGYYDLVGPHGDVILPYAWETIIEPGMKITMLLWPRFKRVPEDDHNH